jgi:hypothetical protein
MPPAGQWVNTALSRIDGAGSGIGKLRGVGGLGPHVIGDQVEDLGAADTEQRQEEVERQRV